MIRRILLLIVVVFLPGPAGANDVLSGVQGMSPEEAFRLGERMYRDGILPSGEPMQAIVMGDIPVDGRMFTCDDCHQRSGLGSVEGTVITWPTNGKELFQPRRRTGALRPWDSEGKTHNRHLPQYYRIENARPAYTDSSLARALRTGVDPAGRTFDPIMPLYLLNDRDMAVMIYYLRNLSVEIAPGVDEKTIRFATVVTDGVAPSDRQTMLSTLQVHIDVNNAQTRHQEHRAASGPFYKTEKHQAYRRMHLDVWELHGPEDTWPEQLQAYYRQQPVFALLGGIAAGSWQPIHEFCEQNKVPAIFPLTDFPVVSESDWYTLYLDKGYFQEGKTAAEFLHIQEHVDPSARTLIVSRDTMAAQTLYQGFAESWQEFGRTAHHLVLPPDQQPDARFWQDLIQTERPEILLLWLAPDDLGALAGLAGTGAGPDRIMLSAKMLDFSFATVPEGLRQNVYLTYLSSLPATRDKRMVIIDRWLKARNIPATDPEMQARLYFLGWMLPGAVRYMRSEFFREYFLEGFDMMIDQDYAIAVYPRLTFGPGQRYAAKGCYVVQLSAGENPELLKKSEWVIY